MMKKTLVIESLENHQKLIDIFLEHKNKEGICAVTRKELSTAMNRSLTWIKKAIDQINREDLCIETVGRNRYIVHYEDLTQKGVYNVVLTMILYTFENADAISWKDEMLMQHFGCTLKTVQMYRAYCLTGWKKGMK